MDGKYSIAQSAFPMVLMNPIIIPPRSVLRRVCPGRPGTDHVSDDLRQRANSNRPCRRWISRTRRHMPCRSRSPKSCWNGSPPCNAFLSVYVFASVAVRRYDSRKTEDKTMAWTTPVLVEICIGLEINGYLPAEF